MSDFLSQKLRQLTLTLYAFHLQNDSSSGQKRSVDNAHHIWDQIATTGQELNIPQLENIKQQLACYPNDSYQPIVQPQNPDTRQNLLPRQESGIEFATNQSQEDQDSPIHGQIFAVLMNNTYAVDLTTYCKSLLEVRHICQLNLFSSKIKASLGQTLLLYAEVDRPKESARALADACASQIFQDSSASSFLGSGQLLSSSFFEYGMPSATPSNQQHVLVWLNYGQSSPEQQRLTDCLIQILLSRHKILHTYHQSRQFNSQARDIYSELEHTVVERIEGIAQSSDRLQQFRSILRAYLPQQSFRYNRLIRSLLDCSNTLKAGLNNHQQMSQELCVSKEDKLDLFEKFSELTENKYLKQVQIDLDYLMSGQTLFQQLIDTIRGLAEMEKIERSYRLETTIQILGVALATGAIISGGYVYAKEPFRAPFSTNTLHPFIIYLLWTFGTTFAMGSLVYLLNRFVIFQQESRYRKKKYKHNRK